MEVVYVVEYVMIQDKFEAKNMWQSRWSEEMRSMGETPEPRTRRASMSDASPGRTPRSAVQRNLAKLGMINSPDRREMLSTLEEFLAQLLEAKEMGIDEEDLRSQMAASAGVNLRHFTKTLYDQAVEEQRKGTKGLTKFLAKVEEAVGSRAYADFKCKLEFSGKSG